MALTSLTCGLHPHPPPTHSGAPFKLWPKELVLFWGML